MENKFVSMDTEKSPSGSLGEWSIGFRDTQGRLCIWRSFGATEKVHLKNVFRNSSVVFHNAKYDVRELKANRMPVPDNFHDTMIAAYCLGLGRQAPTDSTKTKSGSAMVGGLGLKYLARRHLGMEMKTWQEVKDHPEMKAEYNDADSVATYLLFEKWKPKLPEHYWKIDMPLLPVLMAIEDRGWLIDPDYLGTFSKYLDKQLDEIELPLSAYSSPQIHSYVYGTLGIEPWKFTDSGAPSTDADVLESIDDPVVQGILKYRELHKEKGTYTDNYVEGSKADGRIRAELKQTSTATGRLSCARPNLQNVPKEGEMRKLFIAPEGKSLVRLDYKLIEFGMLAVLANDEKLIEAFLHGDIHQETADAMNVSRDIGKRMTFLMQNGGTAWGMSRDHGIPLGQAKAYITGYFERFPAIKRYHDEIVAIARETRKVTGHFGRVRRLDAMYAPDWRVRQDGEREAKTMPMQNGAAEVVKLAMIDLHYKHSAPMLMQVHDELIFEVLTKEAEEYASWLRIYVPTITEINGIQFPVEVGVGNNWKEVKENAR